MTLAGVFGPLGQVFIFVVGSAIVLSVITVLVAFLLRGTRTNVDLVQATLTILPQVIVDGLVRGFLFATIALGYTMVYGVLEFINFAHGEIFMVGAFSGAALGTVFAASGILNALPPLLFVLIAVIVGMVISGTLAVTIERIAYRPLRNAPRLVPLISAIGVSLLLQDGMRLIANVTGLGFNARFPTPNFGPPLQLAQIPAADGRTIPLILDVRALIFIVAATLMLIGLNYLVNATKLGTAIRAVAQDRPTASLMGINVNQIIALTFLIGGALGGAAGVLFGIRVGTVNPYIGFLPGLKAFTAAVLGGIGNIPGAMVGGIVLGFLEAFVASYLSLLTGGAFSGASYADIVAFAILILILIFRPSGLLGEAVAQKV
ncbi:MAG: branched-chain amino acid ABC transporter permease [Chloroflexi bacterium]|uniref:Branched-chain amino acid ABC transporter permease n=2 Tax=Candidatus Thermofonsia Clade 3 TaxID=2364209 RepID=A0A2M8QGS6_9CHLR|nr:MAG: branched-chain amino acid ABC transporter permease [Candidatus Thermofonsia Clade 3 bacterium]RMG63397.1 MAG: branched-chain amino acid ABC transporter permease [Chloroflexota bacterium]